MAWQYLIGMLLGVIVGALAGYSAGRVAGAALPARKALETMQSANFRKIGEIDGDAWFLVIGPKGEVR